jgi:hypothetical protein
LREGVGGEGGGRGERGGRGEEKDEDVLFEGRAFNETKGNRGDEREKMPSPSGAGECSLLFRARSGKP